MKTRVINFKKSKIENSYDNESLVCHIPTNWLSITLQEQQEWFDKIKNFINQQTMKNVTIELRYSGDIKLEAMEKLQLVSKTAELTITEESTGKEYLAIPPCFHEFLFATVYTQKNLGNFKNKFEKLQILLYDNDEVIEKLVE